LELTAGFPLARSDLGAGTQNSGRRRFALLCTARRPPTMAINMGSERRERAPLDFPLARQAILHFVADLLYACAFSHSPRLQKDTREHNAYIKNGTRTKNTPTFVKGWTHLNSSKWLFAPGDPFRDLKESLLQKFA